MISRVFIDIETAPVAETDPAWMQWLATQDRDVRAPGNLRDPEKIAAAIAEKRAALAGERDRTALDPMLGSIVAIGVALDTGPVTVLHGTDERALLNNLAAWLPADAVSFVGHNIAGFDAPWIQARAYRHGLRHLAHRFGAPGCKPWDRPLEDTRDLWPCRDVRGLDVVRGVNGASLPSLCRFLGVDIADDDISGADVAAALARGDVEAVVEHCRRDVERVREVYALLTGW